METSIQIWLVSCWLAAILFVVAWTIWGVSMVSVSDRQVLLAAASIRSFQETQRQFALFIQAVNRPDTQKIDTGVLSEMREVWHVIETEAEKMGITPMEFMLQAYEALAK